MRRRHSPRFRFRVQHQLTLFANLPGVRGCCRSCSCGPRHVASVCNRTSHGRPCADFPVPNDAERIVKRGRIAGTPLVEALFPSALGGRVACICVAVASLATRCPATALSLVPARSSLDRGESLLWRALPLRFSDAQAVRLEKARRGPIADDLDFVFDRSGDCARSSTSMVWLAIRTSRPYLSATNVRL